jgi:hypothetical protein
MFTIRKLLAILQENVATAIAVEVAGAGYRPTSTQNSDIVAAALDGGPNHCPQRQLLAVGDMSYLFAGRRRSAAPRKAKSELMPRFYEPDSAPTRTVHSCEMQRTGLFGADIT